jgi:hypothetical protein
MVEAERGRRGAQMKVVINRCFGGYSLSRKAYKALGLEWDGYGYACIDDRTNKKLVGVVEKLGSAANGRSAMLKVVDVPGDVTWTIDCYDGLETVHEVARVWGDND